MATEGHFPSILCLSAASESACRTQGTTKPTDPANPSASPPVVGQSFPVTRAVFRRSGGGPCHADAASMGGPRSPRQVSTYRPLHVWVTIRQTAWHSRIPPNGVRAAHAAGLITVQVPDIFAPDAELRALGHYTASNIIAGARKVGLMVTQDSVADIDF